MQQDRYGNAPMQLAHAGGDRRHAASARSPPAWRAATGSERADWRPSQLAETSEAKSLTAAGKTCRPEALASDAAQLWGIPVTDLHFALDTESAAS